MKEPLIDRAREAFAEYDRGPHPYGREIIDELIFALTVANAEVVRLLASHDRLLAAANWADGVIDAIGDQTGVPPNVHLSKELKAAIAAAEELKP
jgi:hypothetical protein